MCQHYSRLSTLSRLLPTYNLLTNLCFWHFQRVDWKRQITILDKQKALYWFLDMDDYTFCIIKISIFCRFLIKHSPRTVQCNEVLMPQSNWAVRSKCRTFGRIFFKQSSQWGIQLKFSTSLVIQFESVGKTLIRSAPGLASAKSYIYSAIGCSRSAHNIKHSII